MAKNTTIRFETAPLHGNTVGRGQPFEQVLSAEVDGNSWRSAAILRHPNAATRSFKVPTTMAERVIAFAQRYLVEGTDRFYNCHGFAAVVAGGVALDQETDFRKTYAQAQKLVQSGREQGRLQPGQAGAIGVRSVGETEAYHSLVGLDRNNALQINDIGLQLCISTYDNVLHYQRMTKGIPLLKLYA